MENETKPTTIPRFRKASFAAAAAVPPHDVTKGPARERGECGSPLSCLETRDLKKKIFEDPYQLDFRRTGRTRNLKTEP